MKNNRSKITLKKDTAQHLAGLMPKDSGIEFWGDRETQKVYWQQHGSVHRFEDLSGENYTILWKAYDNDRGAKAILGNLPCGLDRKVELYAYYMFGDLDSIPDLKDGKLNYSENFREKFDCVSLGFDKKYITVGETVLSERDLAIIDMIKQDLPDKAIAALLPNRNGSKGIEMSTLDSHKKKLFKKTGTNSRTSLALTAIANGI